MDYGYSTGYRGQTVNPLPAGFMEAATEPGRNIARGIENAGAGVGKMIEKWKAKHQENKQKLALVKALSGSEDTVKALGYQTKEEMLNDSSDNVIGATKALVFRQGVQEANDAAALRRQQVLEGQARLAADARRQEEEKRQRDALAKFQGLVAQGGGAVAAGIQNLLKFAGLPTRSATLDPEVLTRYAAQAGVLTAPQALDAAAQARAAEIAAKRAATDAIQATSYRDQVQLTRERATREPKIVDQNGTKLLVQPSGQAEVMPERPAGKAIVELPDGTKVERNLTKEQVDALTTNRDAGTPKFDKEVDRQSWQNAKDAIRRNPAARSAILSRLKAGGVTTEGL